MNSLILRQEGPVAYLILSRPPINALDREALEEIGLAVEEIRADRETRVLVITGGIEGIFCSGGDLKYWRQAQNENEAGKTGRRVFAQLEQLPKPTIAAINGQIIGDGLALALSCDLRIASPLSTFRLPEVAYGFIPGWGLIRRLIASVGRTHASQLLLTGLPVDAHRAYEMGLLSEVFPAERFMDEVRALGARMATLSPAALQAAKCALRGGDEKACFEAVWSRNDRREGIVALFSKRTPVYGFDDQGGDGCDHIGRVQTD
jgi:enoyl-CoA hydratase/carnithine racemase